MGARAKKTKEPFGLSTAAIRQIAEGAGLDDENDARRVLRVFERSPECRAQSPRLDGSRSLRRETKSR
jgi:hypothetical protein